MNLSLLLQETLPRLSPRIGVELIQKKIAAALELWCLEFCLFSTETCNKDILAASYGYIYTWSCSPVSLLMKNLWINNRICSFMFLSWPLPCSRFVPTFSSVLQDFLIVKRVYSKLINGCLPPSSFSVLSKIVEAHFCYSDCNTKCCRLRLSFMCWTTVKFQINPSLSGGCKSSDDL